MRRREFITLLVDMATMSICRPLAADAQQLAKVGRLGVLSQGSARAHPTPVFRAIQQACASSAGRWGKIAVPKP